MRRNHLLLLVLLAIVVAAAAVVYSRRPSGTGTAARYCSPDGALAASQAVQSHRSYCVRPLGAPATWSPGVPASLTFDIVDDRGEVLRRFLTVHEKQMHVIIVRKDLAEFQHVHPKFDPASGRYTLADLVLPSVGEYRLFADFAPAGAQRGPDGMPLMATPFTDLRAGDLGRYGPVELGEANRDAVIGDYTVDLDAPDTLVAGTGARLTFTVREKGRAVADLEPYLGALGHAVVLREGDLQFLHTHAEEAPAAGRGGQVPFVAHVPAAGRYKAFVQFQHRGRVLTAAFVLPPAIGASPSAPSTGGGHRGH